MAQDTLPRNCEEVIFMSQRLSAALLLGLVAAVAFYAAHSLLSPAPAQAQARENPVVAAFAFKTQTRFTQDPFDQTRVSESEGRVEKIVLVYADGKVDFKFVGNER